jgi:type VI secretion system secreted protein VgrG
MSDFVANVAHHHFEVSTLSPDVFTVVDYTGTESISNPFEFEVALVSDDPEIAFRDVVNQPATLTTKRGGDEVPTCGIVSNFYEEGPSADGQYRYRAVLVPRLWWLSLRYQSRIFQEVTVEEILTQVLQDADLPSSSFRFELSESYSPREYCVQHQETDLAFLQRLLEFEGIQYFFEHDGTEDVVVFTDDRAHNPEIATPATLDFNASQGNVPDDESVYRFTGRERVVTGSVVLKDYNYRTPETRLEVESQINEDMPGMRYEYGDHFSDTETGKRLARVRNEEIECHRKVLKGESTCAGLRPGHTFTLEGHYRSDGDGEYLVTDVQHHGVHGATRNLFRGDGSSASTRDTDGTGEATEAAPDEPVYRNEFTCIPAEVTYRPPRTTPVPKVPGIMTARTESAGGDYAYVDEEGRYRLKMDFDRRTDTAGGEATLPIRKGQMHTGPNHGVHFGEHEDTEMLWACMNGDPNRPVVLSSVANPSQKSPVVAENKAENIIRTKAGNQLVMDDTIDKAKVKLESPDANLVHLDDENDRIQLSTTKKHIVTLDDKNENLALKTEKGHTLVFDDKNEAITLQSVKEHFIRINDKDEVITLSDKDQKNLVVLDLKNDKIVIKTENGSIDMHAPKGKIDIQAKELNVETKGDTKMKAANIKTEAKSEHAMKAANVNVEAKMDLQQKGTNVKSKASMNHETSGMNVKSQASMQNDVSGTMTNLKASGINTIQGSLVKIN